MKVYLATLYHWNDDYKKRYDDDDWDEKKAFTTKDKALMWLNQRIETVIVDYFENHEIEVPAQLKQLTTEYCNKKLLFPQEKIDELHPAEFVHHSLTYDLIEMEVF